MYIQYLYRTCISGWCRIWDIGITFNCFINKYTSGRKKQTYKKKRREENRKRSKKWIIPQGYSSSHILSDMCITRLKCQCLPLDNCMFNSAWLVSSSFLLCIALFRLSLVIVTDISSTACERFDICYCLTILLHHVFIYIVYCTWIPLQYYRKRIW